MTLSTQEVIPSHVSLSELQIDFDLVQVRERHSPMESPAIR